jgi:hypothetical protein
MLRKFVVGAVFSCALLAPGTALADQGGLPNGNAFPPSEGSGRKAQCVPPGLVIRNVAKAPGTPNDVIGQPAGQEMIQSCGLGQPVTT